MQCESRLLKSFIALRRAKTLAVALLVPVIIIGVLGAAVPALQAQQAALAAPAGFQKAAPSPKAETPPPAESTAELIANIANSVLPGHQFSSVSITTAFLNFMSNNRESQKFTTERKL